MKTMHASYASNHGTEYDNFPCCTRCTLRTYAFFVYNTSTFKSGTRNRGLRRGIVANPAIDLEVESSGPFVDNVQHRLLFNSSGEDKRDDSQHSQASVDDFGFFREAGLKFWQVSEWLRVSCHGCFVRFVIGVQQERVSERKRTDGGHEGDSEEVDIGHQDDGTPVGDGSLSGDGGKGTPFLKVERHIGIGDKSVSLGVRGSADEDPSEHGVTSVPLFGVDGWAPSVLGKRGEFFFPSCLGLFVDLRGCNVQVAAGLLGSGRLGRAEGTGNTKGEEKGDKSSERCHLEYFIENME
mmetsp:Transcript_10882/g.23066  ORF Transcript_10882/g.23066 Transcript_10882/m.23066 type:complete len:295 (+) Transcript_10882:78-962(+)